MTLENCERLLENCLKHGDAAGAKIYEERIARKKKRLGIVSPPSRAPAETKPKEKK